MPQYLINNAGVASWGDLGKLTEDELLHCIRTNTLGPLLVTQEVLGTGLLKRGSVVANLTSKVRSHNLRAILPPSHLCIIYALQECLL